MAVAARRPALLVVASQSSTPVHGKLEDDFAQVRRSSADEERSLSLIAMQVQRASRSMWQLLRWRWWCPETGHTVHGWRLCVHVRISDVVPAC